MTSQKFVAEIKGYRLVIRTCRVMFVHKEARGDEGWPSADRPGLTGVIPPE